MRLIPLQNKTGRTIEIYGNMREMQMMTLNIIEYTFRGLRHNTLLTEKCNLT